MNFFSPFVYFLFFLFALIYSSVGLGGGSAYVALMSFSGVPHKFLPSTSLFLNVLTSFIAFSNYRVHIDFKNRFKFLTLLYLLSLSGVYIGTKIKVERELFMRILGFVLILLSVISIFENFIKKLKFRIKISIVPFFGFVAGIIAGLLGIGGGILVSSVLIFSGTPEKEIPGILSIFVLINSFFGFIFHFIRGNVDFSLILPLTFFVITGSILGSFLGSYKLKPIYVKKILNLIILSFGVKILWESIL
ncbi:MAG: sulfite exporter TauE/SafE family protein [Candidatus Omnitrophica bacterium]|nr:sulfite exporter TauE/SafE family protein [Candidatus Omnitrophota bacterium]